MQLPLNSTFLPDESLTSELRAAADLQQNFFPSAPYLNTNLAIAGASIPASLCNGDWWYYSEIGPYFIVVIGDAQGHGVAAALLTGIARSAYHLAISHFLRQPHYPPDLMELVDKINLVLWEVLQGQLTMTLTALLIDTRKGLMATLNAGHVNPYLIRPVQQPGERKPFREDAQVLFQGATRPLGERAQTQCHARLFQLRPGDLIFLYTDGLFEQRSSDQKKMKKRNVVTEITQLWAHKQLEAPRIVEIMISKALDFFKSPCGSLHLKDDLSLVLISIPPDANL